MVRGIRAPRDASLAIDRREFDLAQVASALGRPEARTGDAGAAAYLLSDPGLARALRQEYMRQQWKWQSPDGLPEPEPGRAGGAGTPSAREPFLLGDRPRGVRCLPVSVLPQEPRPAAPGRTPRGPDPPGPADPRFPPARRVLPPRTRIPGARVGPAPRRATAQRGIRVTDGDLLAGGGRGARAGRAGDRPHLAGPDGRAARRPAGLLAAVRRDRPGSPRERTHLRHGGEATRRPGQPDRGGGTPRRTPASRLHRRGGATLRQEASRLRTTRPDGPRSRPPTTSTFCSAVGPSSRSSTRSPTRRCPDLPRPRAGSTTRPSAARIWKPWWTPRARASRSVFESFVAGLDRAIRGGHFPALPNPGVTYRVCDYCDYLPVCGPRPAGYARTKARPGFAAALDEVVGIRNLP